MTINAKTTTTKASRVKNQKKKNKVKKYEEEEQKTITKSIAANKSARPESRKRKFFLNALANELKFK